jgi:hypothetical protein
MFQKFLNILKEEFNLRKLEIRNRFKKTSPAAIISAYVSLSLRQNGGGQLLKSTFSQNHLNFLC